MNRWVHVDGRCRCTRCGKLVGVTWKYFPTPATWTLAYCEHCVEELLEVAGGAR